MLKEDYWYSLVIQHNCVWDYKYNFILDYIRLQCCEKILCLKKIVNNGKKQMKVLEKYWNQILWYLITDLTNS